MKVPFKTVHPAPDAVVKPEEPSDLLWHGVAWAPMPGTGSSYQPAFITIRGGVATFELLGPPELRPVASEALRVALFRRVLGG